MTEKVSWRRLVAEIALAEHLPMPTSIDLIGDPHDDESHLSLWTLTEADKAAWQQFTGCTDASGSWLGWDMQIHCVRQQMPADPLDEDTRAALAALPETE